jgi:hypothetical protein
MTELRKKLTDIQFRLLMDAQIKYDNAADVLKVAATALNKVRMLVLDAHGVDETTPVLIDVESQELVIEEEEVINA